MKVTSAGRLQVDKALEAIELEREHAERMAQVCSGDSVCLDSGSECA
jgi:hypothetical protein